MLIGRKSPAPGGGLEKVSTCAAGWLTRLSSRRRSVSQLPSTNGWGPHTSPYPVSHWKSPLRVIN